MSGHNRLREALEVMAVHEGVRREPALEEARFLTNVEILRHDDSE